MIAILAQLWGSLSVQSRELLAQLFAACVRLGAALGQPQQDPGWSEPVLTVGAESTAEQVRDALTRYEALATRFDGLRLASLLSRAAQPLAPSWTQILERARALNATELVAAIESLQGAIVAWNANASATTPAIEDSQTRLWLLSRLSRLDRAPEQPRDGGEASKGLLIVLGLFVVAGLARRSR